MPSLRLWLEDRLRGRRRDHPVSGITGVACLFLQCLLEALLETRTLQEPPLATTANIAEVFFLTARLSNDWFLGKCSYDRF